MKIAVVVPYFQREPGVLRRCLESVIAQELEPGWTLDIIVVDDASPVPASLEFEGMVFTAMQQVRVIAKANGGPGAARNTGLDHVQADTEFVAFIDSDDLWAPSHLRRAGSALGEARDFYFCNVQEGDSDQFASSNFIVDQASPDYRRETEDSFDFYVFDGGKAVDHVLRSYISHTSSVVYRHGRYPGLRFDASQSAAGEDHLFWAMLAKGARAVCFSETIGAKRGKGDNLYVQALDFNNQKYLIRIIDVLAMRKKMRAIPGLSSELYRFLDQEIRARRSNLLYTLVKFAAARRLDRQSLARLHSRDAAFWLHAPFIGGQMGARRIMNRLGLPRR